MSNEESALKGTIPDPELQRPSRNSEMVESQQIVDLWRRARERGEAVEGVLRDPGDAHERSKGGAEFVRVGAEAALFSGEDAERVSCGELGR